MLLLHFAEFLPSGYPALDASELNLILITVLAKQGRRTGGPTTAPSIGHDGLVLWDLRDTTFQFAYRDVGVAGDHSVLLEFLGRADV